MDGVTPIAGSGRGSGPSLGRADLHVHSWWSDGTQSPEDLVRAATGRVDVLAITDHDEIAGALQAREFARDRPDLGVNVVVGEEVSTLNGHLLALYFARHASRAAKRRACPRSSGRPEGPSGSRDRLGHTPDRASASARAARLGSRAESMALRTPTPWAPASRTDPMRSGVRPRIA